MRGEVRKKVVRREEGAARSLYIALRMVIAHPKKGYGGDFFAFSCREGRKP
jgi:hypothetical protein